MLEIRLQGLNCIKVAFTQSMNTRICRAERVEQCHVNQVIAFGATCYITTGFRNIDAHTRRVIEMTRIIGMAILYEINHERIKLYCLDRLGLVIKGEQNI